MRISHVKISNFRNLKEIEVDLDQHAVIVGENSSGKTNFLEALRLVLDPSLPDSRRTLNADDFWEGIKPFGGESIQVSIQFSDFEDNQALLACLSDAIVESKDEKSVAELTYTFRPRVQNIETRKGIQDEYEFIVYLGNDKDKPISWDLRTWVQIFVLQALRDAESDFKKRFKSPLRPFFERIYGTIDLDKLDGIVESVKESSDELTKLDEIDNLRKSITSRVIQMIGENKSVNPNFGVSSTESGAVLNSLKLFLDGGRSYDFDKVSLGYANLIYLVLHTLNIETKQEMERIAACVFAIEEPEAHLHPQIQRLVFKDIFQRNNPTLTTTHSPNIVSVAPINSIVLLKNKGNAVEAKSLANCSLSTLEKDDLSRYIDVTKGEIYFAKGIMFVEGQAEVFLIPRIAELMNINLDQLGISICSVNGVDFLPYLKLVGSEGLDIPRVVLTDGDLDKEVNGYQRVENILKHFNENNLGETVNEKKFSESYELLKANNFYVGENTLELDLLINGQGNSLIKTFKELNGNAKPETIERFRSIANLEKTSKEDLAWFLDKINLIGKGRFSQRLASNIVEQKFPVYITDAIKKIVALTKV